MLDTYGTNLTEQAKLGKVDRVITAIPKLTGLYKFLTGGQKITP